MINNNEYDLINIQKLENETYMCYCINKNNEMDYEIVNLLSKITILTEHF